MISQRDEFKAFVSVGFDSVGSKGSTNVARDCSEEKSMISECN